MSQSDVDNARAAMQREPTLRRKVAFIEACGKNHDLETDVEALTILTEWGRLNIPMPDDLGMVAAFWFGVIRGRIVRRAKPSTRLVGPDGRPLVHLPGHFKPKRPRNLPENTERGDFYDLLKREAVTPVIQAKMKKPPLYYEPWAKLHAKPDRT